MAKFPKGLAKHAKIGRYAASEDIKVAAEKIRGRTLGDIADITYESASDKEERGKASAAMIVEDFFGLPQRPSEHPSFLEAGMELKVTPVVARWSGQMVTPKERLVISRLDYQQIAEADYWYEIPALRDRLQQVFFVWYLHDKETSLMDNMILWADVWVPDKVDSARIQHDFEIIKDQVLDGERLSGTDTSFLSTCPKHGGGFEREDPSESRKNALVAPGDHPTLSHAEKRAWTIKRGAIAEVFAELTPAEKITKGRSMGVSLEELKDSVTKDVPVEDGVDDICPRCGEQHDNLQGHYTAAHGSISDIFKEDGLYRCPRCSFTCRARNEFSNHFSQDHEPSMTEHFFAHGDELDEKEPEQQDASSERRTCPECGEKKPTDRALRSHFTSSHGSIKRHFKEGSQYECPECRYSTSNNVKLSLHFKKQHGHTMSSYFLANYDQLKSPEESTVDTESGPDECPVCGHTSRSLRDHYTAKHGSISDHFEQGGEYECPECGAEVKSSARLSLHFQEKHSIMMSSYFFRHYEDLVQSQGTDTEEGTKSKDLVDAVSGEAKGHEEYRLPILKALYELGPQVSWSSEEIQNKWRGQYLELSKEDLEHEESGFGDRQVYKNRHAWALVNLQKEGLIEKVKDDYRITQEGIDQLEDTAEDIGQSQEPEEIKEPEEDGKGSQILQDMRRVRYESGEDLSMFLYDMEGRYSIGDIKEEFGSWEAALRKID